jgi:hypothetical protein
LLNTVSQSRAFGEQRVSEPRLLRASARWCFCHVTRRRRAGALRSGLLLLGALGLGQLLLDLFEVLWVELAAHLTERAFGFSELERTTIEIDTDEAHGQTS